MSCLGDSTYHPEQACLLPLNRGLGLLLSGLGVEIKAKGRLRADPCKNCMAVSINWGSFKGIRGAAWHDHDL